MMPRVWVITGGIGAGKTAALSIFKDLSYPVFSADNYSKDLYEGEILEKVRKHFPSAINHDRLDRKILRSIVSKDEGKRQILNSISHGEIINRLIEDLESCGEDIAVVEIPLYSEVKDMVDGKLEVVSVIYIDSNEELRISRIMERDHADRPTAKNLINRQIYDKDNKELADYIIVNNGDLSDLKGEIEAIMRC